MDLKPIEGVIEMMCPNCFTSWEVETDYIEHLEAHGIDPWKCKQLRKDVKALTLVGRHRPTECCTCPLWGARFECEMKIYKAR